MNIDLGVEQSAEIGTVDVLSEGGTRFLPDVYQRDGRILEELEEDFKLILPTDFNPS